MAYTGEIKWVCIFRLDGGLHLLVATSAPDIVATRKNIQMINPKMQIVDSYKGKPGLRPLRDPREIEELRIQIIEDEPDHVPLNNETLAVTADQATEMNAGTFDDVNRR